MSTPLPPGLPVVLDSSVRRLDGGRLLVGGRPRRAIRLTEEGARALDALLAGCETSEAARVLGRRLVDAGLVHPRPPAAPVLDVTVVVPVRDRPAELDACLAALRRPAPGGGDHPGGDHPGASAPPRVLVVDDASLERAPVAAACARHGAELVRLDPGLGPAGARNAALEHVATPLVAFLDSDTVPPPGWLDALAAHLADPQVAAVAPRIVPLAAPGGRPAGCPLDMGPHPGVVGPGRGVPYVPSAALLVRRDALAGCGPFDTALRYGEDVDLVWRLVAAGATVRYEPGVQVAHREPRAWAGALGRRYRYGTSVAPLSRRHPGRLGHAAVSPWSAGVLALLALGRPRWAVLVALLHGGVSARAVARHGLPLDEAGRAGAVDVSRGLALLARSVLMLAAPLVAAGLLRRSTRKAALLVLLVHALEAVLRERPRSGLLRVAAGAAADDVAYGAGVIAGCIAGRTAAPLRPVRPRDTA